jgi:hypothetical protein
MKSKYEILLERKHGNDIQKWISENQNKLKSIKPEDNII